MKPELKSGLALLVTMLILLALLPASQGYTFYMPVIVHSTTSPEVLMPGDTAVLTIEMENGAAQYGVGGENAKDATISTPINKTELLGTDEIEVVSGDYTDIGMMGPNDKVVLYYKIKANDSIPDGTYFLDFKVSAGYELMEICRKIPIKVDSAGVGLSRADASVKSSFSLNVANPRANTLNAVTIMPSAEGIRFSPEEYYIGTMDPDEIFTISFTVDSGKPQEPIKDPVSLNFSSKFKNGDTWHQSGMYSAVYVPMPDDSGNGNLLPMAALGILILVGGGYLYWRKKHPGEKIFGKVFGKQV